MHKSILFTLMAVASILPSIAAKCCGGPFCGDGTQGTPCCATQKCNIFCCSCGGHCRNAKRDLMESIRSVDPTEEIFKAVNMASDGKLTLDEFLGWTKEAGQGFNESVWTSHFNRFDKENKGFVTIEQANSQE